MEKVLQSNPKLNKSSVMSSLNGNKDRFILFGEGLVITFLFLVGSLNADGVVRSGKICKFAA